MGRGRIFTDPWMVDSYGKLVGKLTCNPQIGSIYHLYTTYKLPSGRLYATYHHGSCYGLSVQQTFYFSVIGVGVFFVKVTTCHMPILQLRTC